MSKIKDKDLPENMRQMSPKQRQEYVKQQAAKRKQVQKQINDLNTARTKYVAAKRKETTTGSGKRTLDQALGEAIRAQASARNFKFKTAADK